MILYCCYQLLWIKLVLIQFLALTHLLCIWCKWLLLVEAYMNSRYAFLLPRGSPWTFHNLSSCLRLLQKLLLRLHYILFHCLECNLCGIIYRYRHYRTRRPHIRCFALLISFVSHPTINFWFHFPSNFTLYNSLILFPLQKALCLSFLWCHLWLPFGFLWLLTLFRLYPIWLCAFIMLHLWLACNRSLPFSFLCIRFKQPLRERALGCFISIPLLLFLFGLFNCLSRIILLPLLEILGVLLLGNHFLWVLLRRDSPLSLLRLMPCRLRSHWLLAWRLGWWCILMTPKGLLDHVLEVVLGRHNLTRIWILCCLWLLFSVESESRHYQFLLLWGLFLIWELVFARLNIWNLIDDVVYWLWTRLASDWDVVYIEYLLSWLDRSVIFINVRGRQHWLFVNKLFVFVLGVKHSQFIPNGSPLSIWNFIKLLLLYVWNDRRRFLLFTLCRWPKTCNIIFLNGISFRRRP